MSKAASFSLLFALVFGLAQSEKIFRFANIFGSHMVLQKTPKRASIWGYGEVGEEVIVIFSGDMYRSFITAQTTGAEKVGIWSVMLTPMMFGGPYQIEAHSKVNGIITTLMLEDVMFGDVWFCSGQSNMEMAVNQTENGQKAVNDAVHYPDIRLFTADLDCQTTPQMELNIVRQPWCRASPETVGGPDWKYFSAVCWYYGVQLYNELKYPIGLIVSEWGGTPVEAWSSPAALATCGINQSAAEIDLHLGGPRKLSCLWNAMVYPFLNMTIYGSIWYQGEENAQRPMYEYNCTFPAMIDDWRAKWYASTQHNTDEAFPFGFVQLAAVGNDTTSMAFNFSALRWDQTAHYGYVPNARQKSVFMAVAMDLGDPSSIYGSIHPRDKTDVGNRLALGGLAVGYGKKVYYTGPLVSAVKQQTKPPSQALEVSFKSLDGGVIEVRSDHGFEIHCENGTWVEAPILNYGEISVLIMPKTLQRCVADKVRYAWSDEPCVKRTCAVYSGDLPAPPFIIDGPFKEGTFGSLYDPLEV